MLSTRVRAKIVAVLPRIMHVPGLAYNAPRIAPSQPRSSSSAQDAARRRVRKATPNRSAGTQRRLRIAHILLPLDEGELAEQLRSKIKGASDPAFADLAQKHSICGSKRNGGELGWLAPGHFYPEVERVALSANVGDIVTATSGRGHHVVAVLEDREEAVVKHMSVQQLAEVLEVAALAVSDGVADQGVGEEWQLLDVREEEEFQIARLPGFRLLPLSRSAEWAADISTTLDPDRPVAVLCHHGMRSMQMAQFLVSRGFKDVSNITGGIDAFSQSVDRSVPMY